MICWLFAKLGTIEFSEWFTMVASIGTVLTAYFSWRAIKQAEELTLKPIIALKQASYLSKTLSITVYNLSKEGDRWARDISIEIKKSNIFIENKGYLGPGESTGFRIENLNESEWQGKIMKVSYKTLAGKTHSATYRFADDVVKASRIHATATQVDLERIN